MADTTEVIYADRDRCCDDRNRGYGAGWGAVGGALVGGGFGAAAVSVWDKVNDVKANVEAVKATVQEARAGIYKDISDSNASLSGRIDGNGREILNNRFTTERGLCDLGYKVNNDIRDLKDVDVAGNNRIMDRLCQMERSQADCCCEIKGLIRDMKNELALQAERNFCAITKNQEAIMCLIKDQAKDQEIARLTRELKFKDDSLLNFKLDALLKKEYGSTAAAAANL